MRTLPGMLDFHCPVIVGRQLRLQLLECGIKLILAVHLPDILSCDYVVAERAHHLVTFVELGPHIFGEVFVLQDFFDADAVFWLELDHLADQVFG